MMLYSATSTRWLCTWLVLLLHAVTIMWAYLHNVSWADKSYVINKPSACSYLYIIALPRSADTVEARHMFCCVIVSSTIISYMITNTNPASAALAAAATSHISLTRSPVSPSVVGTEVYTHGSMCLQIQPIGRAETEYKCHGGFSNAIHWKSDASNVVTKLIEQCHWSSI
jgi:hypothetical protein